MQKLETDIIEACHRAVKRNLGKALKNMKSDLLDIATMGQGQEQGPGSGPWYMCISQVEFYSLSSLISCYDDRQV